MNYISHHGGKDIKSIVDLLQPWLLLLLMSFPFYWQPSLPLLAPPGHGGICASMRHRCVPTLCQAGNATFTHPNFGRARRPAHHNGWVRR